VRSSLLLAARRREISHTAGLGRGPARTRSGVDPSGLQRVAHRPVVGTTTPGSKTPPWTGADCEPHRPLRSSAAASPDAPIAGVRLSPHPRGKRAGHCAPGTRVRPDSSRRADWAAQGHLSRLPRPPGMPRGCPSRETREDVSGGTSGRERRQLRSLNRRRYSGPRAAWW